MEGVEMVGQSRGWNPWNGLWPSKGGVRLYLHENLGERGIQRGSLVFPEILLHLLIVRGVVILYHLVFLLLPGLLRKRLWLLLRRA
jgi:hypothetical protein